MTFNCITYVLRTYYIDNKNRQAFVQKKNKKYSQA